MSPHLSILLPVDGSENSNRAVRLVIALYSRLAPMEVRLLYVQIPPMLGNDLAARDTIEGDSPERAKDAMQAAQLLLESAGIPCTSEIRRGYVAQEIAAYAKDMDCSAIVMGTRGMGTTDQILGSIVRQVVALTALPITLVK